MGVGTKDRLSQYHREFETFFDDAGVPFVSYYVGGVGHVGGPVHIAQYDSFLREYVRNPDPREIWFATVHLRHSERAWVRIEGLKQHYKRSEVHVLVKPSDSVITIKTQGITRLSLFPTSEVIPGPSAAVVLDGQRLDNPVTAEKAVSFALEDDKWITTDDHSGLRKRPGLTGPISDAFSAPFLCVRPTSKPWNTLVSQWADEQLRNLEQRWARTYRGFLPVKDDIDITLQDQQRYHLVLFGDPGSNKLIAQFMDSLNKAQERSGTLPVIGWTEEELTLGTHRFSAQDHAPALIYPNPDAPDRYIVLNPRLSQAPMSRRRPGGPSEQETMIGDFAVLSLSKQTEEAEKVAFGGFFNEEWELVIQGK
jgi:hypothetical protein